MEESAPSGTDWLSGMQIVRFCGPSWPVALSAASRRMKTAQNGLHQGFGQNRPVAQVCLARGLIVGSVAIRLLPEQARIGRLAAGQAIEHRPLVIGPLHGHRDSGAAECAGQDAQNDPAILCLRVRQRRPRGGQKPQSFRWRRALRITPEATSSAGARGGAAPAAGASAGRKRCQPGKPFLTSVLLNPDLGIRAPAAAAAAQRIWR